MAKIQFDDRNGEEQYFYCDFNVLPIQGQWISIRHYNKKYQLEVTDVVHQLYCNYESSRGIDVVEADYSDKSKLTQGIIIHCLCSSEEDIAPLRPWGDF